MSVGKAREQTTRKTNIPLTLSSGMFGGAHLRAIGERTQKRRSEVLAYAMRATELDSLRAR